VHTRYGEGEGEREVFLLFGHDVDVDVEWVSELVMPLEPFECGAVTKPRRHESLSSSDEQ
jgi:hypothetical protein